MKKSKKNKKINKNKVNQMIIKKMIKIQVVQKWITQMMDKIKMFPKNNKKMKIINQIEK